MKRAIDGKHAKSVTAWALLLNGKYVGRIVANYSDNPSGSVVTADVVAWDGALEPEECLTGRAGGHGYHKLSAAVSDALERGKGWNAEQRDAIAKMHGAGEGRMRTFFESLGYVVAEVL